MHPLFAHEVTPPFVLHYHNEMDADGFVYRSRNRALNPLIDAFNRERAELGGLDYDGLPGRRWPGGCCARSRAAAGTSGPVARVRRHRLLAPLRRRPSDRRRGRGR